MLSPVSVIEPKKGNTFNTRLTVCVLIQDTAGEPLYKLFKALKHQVEKGPVDAKVKKAKYTLNDTGLLGDDVEYSVLVSTHTFPVLLIHVDQWKPT